MLWLLKYDYDGPIAVKTVNVKTPLNEYFSFTLDNEKIAKSQYSLPLAYLYEPNSAILKSGAFHSISSQLNIYKLHQHTHLYTSDKLIDFPGRAFSIKTVLPYNTKAFKKIGITQANVTTRNFPESVQQIRKKLKLKDGGDSYLFFTTNEVGNKIIIISQKN